MFPELFRIPGLGIMLSTYGLLLAVAFIVALWSTARLAASDGLPKDRIYDLGLYILAAALVGSKLLMIATEWDSYGGDWRRIFSLDLLRSGGVYFGGFLAALLASVILMRKWRLPWRRTADAFAPGVAIGHAIGRLGCFSAGCCWGKPTASWIGVRFTEKASELTGVPIDVNLIPTQLIESVANLVLAGVLYLIYRRRRFDGQVIFSYMILYSIIRFTIEFWRDDPRGQVLGLSTSQFISVVMFIAGTALMIYHWRRTPARGASRRTDAAPMPS
ncbi:MAG TPA: prolipoprotein diacylglyceryl transferase [Blastocatellia bacterium]|jgi:phosphatidylglycerol:prolipoprotein diacylglycerol transferase|nr:prolipoprotein diacylglyceryl transferase [Blastocatellia bacterium]